MDKMSLDTDRIRMSQSELDQHSSPHIGVYVLNFPHFLAILILAFCGIHFSAFSTSILL